MNFPFNDEAPDVAVDEAQPAAIVDQPDDAPEPPRPQIIISVSDDKLAAYLTLEQNPPEPYQVTEDAIYEAVAAAKVEFGVNLEIIERIIANREYPQALLIAQGQPARPGHDGRLEYLFARAASGSPADRGYRVDFYDLNLVENVSAGQVLVRQIPAVPGEPGMTVHGRLLSVPKVREARLPAGKGTKILPDKPQELIAAADGFVRLEQKSFKQVVVDQMFTVAGSVDMSTGHLDIDGSIRINKDVKDGFKVQATGDIIVGGSVEGCEILAGGRVEVKGGLIGGRNRAVVQAGEDVVIRFAGQADVTAGGNILITEEALNCALQAEQSVIVGKDHKFKGSIIGGRIAAGVEIRAVNIGAEGGARTLLQVGSQPALLARKQQMQLDLNRQQQRLAQIANQLDSLTRRQSDRTADREALQMQRAALEEMQTALQTELKATMAHLEAAGLLPASPADLAEVEAQLRSTAETLLRVKAHIGMLQEPGNAPAEAVSGAQPVSLEQLEVARHNLQQKLAGLKNRYSQMAAQGQNGWAGVPRQVKLSLELARNRLAEMGVELGKLEIEETANRRLDEAIAQLGREQESLQTALDQLHYELQQVQEKLEATDQQEPRVAVTDTLWPGVELTMLSETRRFNEPVRAASLGLSADRQGPIVAVNLR